MFRSLATNLLIAVLAMIGLATSSWAQEDWPNKPITVIVTFAAGGSADLQTRLEAKYLEQILGVPIQVTNVPGGAHIPGVVSFLNKPADGYTWMRFTPPSTIISPLTRSVPYEPLADFQPAWMNTDNSNVLFVSAKSPYESLDDFVAAAQDKQMVIGVNNIGAPPHLAAINLANQFDIEFKALAMKTIPASLGSVVGGQADAAIGQTTNLELFPGELRALVILDQRKAFFEEQLPNVKTLVEMHPDMAAGGWSKSGWTARTGTDPEIVEKMIVAGKQMMEDPDFRAEFAGLGVLSEVYGTDAVLADIKAGLDFYRPILDELGLLAD